MIYVPERFQPRHPFPYPPDNHTDFERWYHENHDGHDHDRLYLPVMWTAYYCKHKFGRNAVAMEKLQTFLNRLDRTKKYYTIIQYDGGLLHDVSHLDIKMFSMSGGRTDYPLPLISLPHRYNPPTANRSLLYNFVGKLTHDIRRQIVERAHCSETYISTRTHGLDDFCDILNKSIFTLCPRGFGPTSFRIQEALQFGSIPVYVSDEFVIPHNIPFDQYGVIVKSTDVHRIDDILSSIPAEEIAGKQENIPNVYSKHYTYEGCQEQIKKELNKCIYPASDIPI